MDELDFRQAMARFATGVTVVGTMTSQGPIGMTATAFSSLSLNPPLVLICIDHRVYIHDHIFRSGHFAVSMLAHHQIELGMRFAGQLDDPPRERFDTIDYVTAESGAPILPDCLAWVDCTLHTTFDGGDHTVFVGRVIAAGNIRDEAPLLYYNRRWSSLAD